MEKNYSWPFSYQMKRQARRFLKNWLVRPVDKLFFGIYRVINPRSRENISQKSFQRILIIRLDRIGDMVLSAPTFRALRQRYPEAKIILLANPYNVGVAQGSPNIDEIMIFDGQNRQSLIEELRRKKFDLAIDMFYHYTPQGARWAYWSRAPYRLGFDVGVRGWLLTHRVKVDTDQKSDLEISLDLARFLGAKADDKRLELPIFDDDKTYVDEILKSEGILEDDFLIAFNPGAAEPARAWVPERFAEIADRLVKEYQAKIVFIGSSKDMPLVETIMGLMHTQATSLAGRTTIKQLAVFLSRCRLLITTNSGPMHIAAAAGTPTISFLGSSPAERWLPAGEGHVVLSKDLECRGCDEAICPRGDKACMQLISVEEVLEVVEKKLGSGNKKE